MQGMGAGNPKCGIVFKYIRIQYICYAYVFFLIANKNMYILIFIVITMSTHRNLAHGKKKKLHKTPQPTAFEAQIGAEKYKKTHELKAGEKRCFSLFYP